MKREPRDRPHPVDEPERVDLGHGLIAIFLNRNEAAARAMRQRREAGEEEAR
jgi:hypothetical protein